MRAAPLKGTCLVCQAPEPTRVAINAAIWPGDGIMRSVTYRSDGTNVARGSGVPSLATCDPKTITRHADHIEASWREIQPGGAWRSGEVPVQTDFASVMESNTRVGARATELIGKLLEEHGELMVVMEPKFVLDVAAKLGMGGAEKRESSRLKRNQQAIDVVAIFAMSSGHIKAPRADNEQAADIEDLRAELNAEKLLLTERAALS